MNFNMDEDYSTQTDETPDEEIQELMENHGLDEETAERVREVMDDLGVDEDDAVELVEEGL